MKRVFAWLICIVLIFGAISGCNTADPSDGTTQPSATEAPHVLKVGYGRADITPAESVPMRGLGTSSERKSEEVKDRLYASCVAFSDETDNTILLYHMDLCHSFSDATMTLKMAISRATEVPGTQIMVTATHNHSAPDLDNTADPAIERYMDSLKKWMIQAAKDALADRKPAQMYTASATVEGLNFIRHYDLSDGTVAGDNFGDFKNKTILGHHGQVDNTMQLLKFTREGGKDIVLMNWQGHPRGHGEARSAILSDVDVIRQELEGKMNCHFAYFLGASGNVNSSSRITEEKVASGYVDNGKRLAQYAMDAAANFKQVQTARLKILGNQYQAESKESPDVKLTLPLFVFSLGEVAFVTAPYEMFSESGIAIKADSPFAMTFVATCANANFTYIPITSTFEYGGYEVGMTKTAQGTAEKLVSEYVSLLKQLNETA